MESTIQGSGVVRWTDRLGAALEVKLRVLEGGVSVGGEDAHAWTAEPEAHSPDVRSSECLPLLSPDTDGAA